MIKLCADNILLKVPSVTSDTVVQSKLKAPIKSQIKPSALPRPMATGIPRPTSRIPMPGFSRYIRHFFLIVFMYVYLFLDQLHQNQVPAQ